MLGAALAAEAWARKAAGRALRFGVVHRYSSHNYMLRYWLAACGIRPDEDVEIATVSPPFVADAMEAGEIDGACVGEPWNSATVARESARSCSPPRRSGAAGSRRCSRSARRCSTSDGPRPRR